MQKDVTTIFRHPWTEYLLAGMGVDPSRIKAANEKGATVLNLARIIKLLAGELSFEALAALPSLREDSSRAEAYERAVSKDTKAQPRPEAKESSGEATASRSNKSSNARTDGEVVRDIQ